MCALGSMLIDGLHIPFVTSLRRLSTVVVVWERLSQYGRAGQPWGLGGLGNVQTRLLGTTITTWQDKPDILGSQRCLREY